MCPTAAELDALPLPASVPTTGTRLCRDGWCWVSHEPQGHDLHAVWSHPTEGAWLVGQAGTVLHWKLDTWTWQSTPTRNTLRGVWGASPDDIWAVGDEGTLLHFDGTGWTTVPAPGDTVDLLSIEGLSSREVWAAGKGGRLLRWDGSAWALVPSGTSAELKEVSVLSADDVWVSAQGVGLLRCTPGGCTAQAGPSEVGATELPRDMWERGSERWVVFGHPPVSYLWKDGAWSVERIAPPPGPDFATTYSDPWVGGANDAWVFITQRASPSIATRWIYHWDGGTWTRLEEPFANLADRRHVSLWSAQTLGGSSPSDLWAIGNQGAVLHWDGSTWRDLRHLRGFLSAYSPSSPTVLGNYTLGLTASPDGARVWANPTAGGSRLDVAASTWATSEGDWHAHLIPPPRGVVSSPRFTVSGTGVQPLEGLQPGDPEPWRTRIHASARDNVWAMDSQRLWAWEGQAWRIALEGQGELFAVWTHGPKDTWVAGAEKLLHWDGEGWQEHPTPGFTASALWGAWRRDLWAVGNKGGMAALFHWEGEQWSEVSSDALQGLGPLQAVAGRCASEVYAAGSGGALLNWDGATWRRMSVPTTLDLYGVTPVGKELWISGANGAVLRQPRPAP
ncbi:photosystem II stability/assembly factor-like uncharacterized protein [Archangium gephyra]|uniref:Photosystem II stability/assembly factor-like uncharacterized protein n=1 Tax=Archangium gephyra TaxID=48 RepID=A0ABX9K903_9BACT|nr:photosystem II stability/assembly factor-like uncharacterized protein [Archangium gephyra]